VTDRSNRALERAFQLKRETGAAPTLLTEIASRLRKDADTFFRDRLPRPSGQVSPDYRHAILCHSLQLYRPGNPLPGLRASADSFSPVYLNLPSNHLRRVGRLDDEIAASRGFMRDTIADRE
jgi:hypothetical protein